MYPCSKGITPLWTPQNGEWVSSWVKVFAPKREPERLCLQTVLIGSSREAGLPNTVERELKRDAGPLTTSSPSPLAKGIQGIGQLLPNRW